MTMRPRMFHDPAFVPLDLRAAFLTPPQRASMLALVEQDRRLRRYAIGRLTLVLGLGAGALALWGVVVTALVLGWLP